MDILDLDKQGLINEAKRRGFSLKGIDGEKTYTATNPFTREQILVSEAVAELIYFVQDTAYTIFESPNFRLMHTADQNRLIEKFDLARYLVAELDDVAYSAVID